MEIERKIGNKKIYDIKVMINTGNYTSLNGVQYTNSCLFIAIHQYLKYSSNYEPEFICVENLRNICGFPGSNDSPFDIDIEGHRNSLNLLGDFLNATINVYYVNESVENGVSNLWIMKPQHIFNREPENESVLPFQINIAAYGSHFELILSETPTGKTEIDDCELDEDIMMVTWSRYKNHYIEKGIKSNYNTRNYNLNEQLETFALIKKLNDENKRELY